MNDLIIAPIRKSDLLELADLYQQLIPNNVSTKKMECVFNRNKCNPNHLVLGAKIDGKLVGTLLAVTGEMLFGQCKTFMVVEDLVVDQVHRRKGIGRALMQHLEVHARKNNCAYIMLITDVDRSDSQNFYASLNYKTDEYCAFKKHLTSNT